MKKDSQAIRIKKATHQSAPNKLLNELLGKTSERKHDEDNLQEAIVKYVRLKYPKAVIFSIPNGGNRDILEATKLVRTGTLAGVPDLFLAMPNATDSGLFIEVKTKTGVLSENQKIIGNKLIFSGYKVLVIRSLDEAMKEIDKYLPCPF